MQSFKSEGIVIKRKNYGEADKLVTFFTKKHGKLQVKAAGIRKISSRRSPHVELLNYSQISVHRGRNFPILIEAQVSEDFSAIKADLTKVGLAYHICELIDGLCPEGQEQEAVFYLLVSTLRELTAGYFINGQSTNQNNNNRTIEQSNNLDYNLNPEAGLLNDSNRISTLIHDFEIRLLSMLGYWHGSHVLAANLDTISFIENIIERRLKSKRIFSKI